MIDLSLNSNFSVHLNDKNGLATVSGREEFEQAVAIALTDYLYSTAVGEFNQSTIVQKLRLIVSRVAQDKDRLDAVEQIVVEPSDDKPNTYEVGIVYDSDEVSSLMVSE